MTPSSKSLRIAFVSDAIYPYNRGGKEMRIFELSTRLASQGHDVHIYTMQWWPKGKSQTEHGVQLHAISRLRPLYSGERRSISQGLLFAWDCLKLVREKFDIIEADSIPFFPLYTLKIVSLIKRRPLFATWHEVWGRHYWQNYLGPWSGLIAAFIEKLSVTLPNHITAVSPHTAERLSSILGYHGVVSTLPNGINLTAIKHIKAATTSTDILYCGRLLAHKNVDQLIRAVALLKPKYPNLSCSIYGEGPEQANLARLIKELRLSNTVQLAGFITDHQDVLSAMKAAKVFVSPSEREGFGMTIIEASACGLPVVTVDAPGNAAVDLIDGQNGTVCQLNPAAIAQAIDPYLKLTKPATVALPMDHDWSAIARKLSNLYVS